MNREDLSKIATVNDLQGVEERLKVKLLDLFGRLENEIKKVGYDKVTGKLGLRDRPFFTPKELSKLLGIGKSTVTRWCSEGKIKALQQGGQGTLWLIPRSELDRLQKQANDLYSRD